MPQQLRDSCVSFPLSKGTQGLICPKAAGPGSYHGKSEVQEKGDSWLLSSEEGYIAKIKSLKTISNFSPGLWQSQSE